MAEEKPKPRSIGLKECYGLLNKIRMHLEKNEVSKAKKLYIQCRKYYAELSDEDKKSIYERIEALYEELAG